MTTIPRIVSADDHVVEPADVWTSRLPAKYRDAGPRVVRDAGRGDDVPGRQVRLRDGRRGADSPTGGSTRVAPSRRPGSQRVRRLRPRRRAGGADDLRRDAPRLLPAGGPPRRHGPQLGRGVAVLPDVPALLRPDVPRGRRQGPRAAVRPGLQRLDGRGVVRGRAAGVSSRCASSRSGTPELAAAEVRRNAARGVQAVCFSELPPTSGCRRCTTPTASGTRSSPRATRPAPSSACTAARARRCRRRRPDAPPAVSLDADPRARARARWPTGCSPACSCATRT